MGTYTTNYNLFLPSIGEQGWGELVNGNFATIDTTMAGLNTRMGTAESNITSLTSRMGTAEPIITSNTSRIGTLETEADALDSRIVVLENTIPEEGVINGNSITANNIITDVASINSLNVPVALSGSIKLGELTYNSVSTSGTLYDLVANETRRISIGTINCQGITIKTMDFFNPIASSLPTTKGVGISFTNGSTNSNLNTLTVSVYQNDVKLYSHGYEDKWSGSFTITLGVPIVIAITTSNKYSSFPSAPYAISISGGADAVYIA